MPIPSNLVVLNKKDGRLLFKPFIQAADGTLTLPGICFISGPTSGLHCDTSGKVHYIENGVDQGLISYGVGTARQILQTNAAGTAAEWTSNIAPGLGTAAAPSISFVGDPNTGIYSPGADQVAISTNGSGRLFVDSSGNVGVGTASPTTLGGHTNMLNIYGSNATGIILGNSTDSSVYITKSSSDLNLRNAAVGNIIFSTSDSERVRITSNGRLGVGTSSPGNTLHLAATGNHGIKLERTGGNPGSASLVVTTDGASQYSADQGIDIKVGNTYNAFTFTAGATERARIDSSGRLLVGTSSVFGPYPDGLFVNASNGLTAQFGRFTNDINSGNIGLFSGRGGSPSTRGIVQNNDFLGIIDFLGDDGTGFAYGARIAAYVDGTPGTNDMPGRLVFSTTADGASSPTERMRITSTGQLRLAGAGITFNGDTATANELDDYEEGTWTPTINTSNNNATVTYTYRQAHYRKVGALVFVAFWLEFRATSIGTGTDVLINDLPFAMSASSARRMGAAAFGRVSGFVTTNPTGLYYIEGSTSSMYFSSITPSNLNTAADMILYGQFTYSVA